MSKENFKLFEELMCEMQSETRQLAASYKEVDHNFIDIDKFIKVLYTLFDINGLLLNSNEINNVSANTAINEINYPNKFRFTSEYPDEQTKGVDLITYEIIKKLPASLGSNKGPFEGTKQYRPMLKGMVKNKVTGELELHLATMMDSLVRFTCWSTSVGQAHKLANFLENFTAKYNWFFRRYLPVIIFEGRRTDSRATDKYGNLRYYPISLDFFIRTTEIYSLSENEVKNIEININKVKAILTDLE